MYCTFDGKVRMLRAKTVKRFMDMTREESKIRALDSQRFSVFFFFFEVFFGIFSIFCRWGIVKGIFHCSLIYCIKVFCGTKPFQFKKGLPEG